MKFNSLVHHSGVHDDLVQTTGLENGAATAERGQVNASINE